MADIPRRYENYIPPIEAVEIQRVTGQGATAQTSVTATWAQPTTPGNLLFAVVHFQQDTTSPTAPAGWTLRQNGVNTTPAPDNRIFVYDITNSPTSRSGAEVFTFGLGVSYPTIMLMELSGVTNHNASGAVAAATSSSLTPSSVTAFDPAIAIFAATEGGYGNNLTSITSAGYTHRIYRNTVSGQNHVGIGYAALRGVTGAYAPVHTFSGTGYLAGNTNLYTPISYLNTSREIVPAVPAGKNLVVRNIHIANDSANVATIDLKLTNTNLWLPSITIPANSTYDWSGFFVMKEGETLTWTSTTDLVYANVSGVETG